MTSSREQRQLRDGTRDPAVTGLEQENAQLRQASIPMRWSTRRSVPSFAVHRIAPAAGFEVLREISQHTNIKLHTIAQMVIDWALGQSLPESVERELGQAVQRRQGQGDAPGRAG